MTTQNSDDAIVITYYHYYDGSRISHETKDAVYGECVDFENGIRLKVMRNSQLEFPNTYEIFINCSESLAGDSPYQSFEYGKRHTRQPHSFKVERASMPSRHPPTAMVAAGVALGVASGMAVLAVAALVPRRRSQKAASKGNV